MVHEKLLPVIQVVVRSFGACYSAVLTSAAEPRRLGHSGRERLVHDCPVPAHGQNAPAEVGAVTHIVCDDLGPTREFEPLEIEARRNRVRWSQGATSSCIYRRATEAHSLSHGSQVLIQPLERFADQRGPWNVVAGVVDDVFLVRRTRSQRVEHGQL